MADRQKRSETAGALAGAMAASISARESPTTPGRWREILRQWGIAAALMFAGSLLVSLAMAPIYLFPLAWIGLVPWLMGVDRLRSRRAAFLIAWGVGSTYIAINMAWIFNVSGPGWAALSLYCGIYWAVAAAIIRGMGWLRPTRAGEAMRNVALIAALWTSLEWIRGVFLTGLAWGFLGHSQTVLPQVCQIADITGVYGVTFLVVMANVAIYFAIRVRPRRMLVGAWSLTGGLAVVVLAYGVYRLQTTVTSPGPAVMVVQSNYPQSNTGAKGADLPEIEKFHLDETTRTLASRPAGSVDLAAWSETMMPPFDRDNIDFLSQPRFASQEAAVKEAADLTMTRWRISNLAAVHGMALIVGGQYSGNYQLQPDHYYKPERRNSAYYFDRTGLFHDNEPGKTGERYDKIHLVPFGEFVPFKASWPWLHDELVSLGPPDMNEYALESGSDLTVFTLDKSPDELATDPAGAANWKFVSPICFEDLDSRLVAAMFRGGGGVKRAQFMVNVTNDGWFKWNENADHFQAAVFRCIENRAPMARAVNTGISGFIDSTGRASNRLPARTAGASVARLALDARVTFYTRYGDVFADMCLLATVIGVVGPWGLARWKRSSSMKTMAMIMAGALALGSLWGCETDPNAQLTRSTDPAPPPPLVQTAIRPDLQRRSREALIALAKSDDPVIRANTLQTMGDSMGADAGPQILAGLDDPDATTQFAALIEVGRLRLASAHDKLLSIHDGSDPSLAVGAIFALHRIGDTRYSHDLEKTAVSPLPSVRADTAVVLGFIGEPSALPILRLLATDKNVGVQQQAAAALWRLHDDLGLNVLSAKAVSKYPDDQIFALDALAAPGDLDVRGQIRAELSCLPPEVQLAAARAMGMLGSDAGYTLGIKYATSSEESQRFLAAQSLGAIGRSDAQDVLARLLDDPSPMVKMAAAGALVQLGHHS